MILRDAHLEMVRRRGSYVYY